jgi:hypothetical protein
VLEQAIDISEWDSDDGSTRPKSTHNVCQSFSIP